MIGTLVELILFFILLKPMEQKDLSVLGLYPSSKQFLQLPTGLTLAVILATVFQLVRATLTGISWKLNAVYSLADFGKSCWWVQICTV